MTMQERTSYRVKDDCIDVVYGNADQSVVDDYQANGIPVEDFRFLLKEWGDDFLSRLEESV